MRTWILYTNKQHSIFHIFLPLFIAVLHHFFTGELFMQVVIVTSSNYAYFYFIVFL